MAARWGDSFKQNPRYIGGVVEAELLGEDPVSQGLITGAR